MGVLLNQAGRASAKDNLGDNYAVSRDILFSWEKLFTFWWEIYLCWCEPDTNLCDKVVAAKPETAFSANAPTHQAKSFEVVSEVTIASAVKNLPEQ